MNLNLQVSLLKLLMNQEKEDLLQGRSADFQEGVHVGFTLLANYTNELFALFYKGTKNNE